MQKQSRFPQNLRSRPTANTGCFGCLASVVRITLALVALSALGLWGFDLWVRTTLSSKPLSEHLRDQRQEIPALFGFGQETMVMMDENGQGIDESGKGIPIPEVANACSGTVPNPSPPPEAWKIFDSAGSRVAARGFVLDKGNGFGIPSLALSADGKTLVSAGKQVRVWDLSARKLRYNLSGPVKFVDAVALSPDSKTIASGDEGGEIWLHDLNTGKLK